MDARWIKLLPPLLRGHLVGRHNLQTIIGNSGWLFADKALRMVVGLLVGVWVARYLGPDRFGQFNYAVAFVSLFGAVATLGLDGIVINELARSPERKDEILGSAFALKLGGASLAFVITLIAIWLLHPKDTITYWMVGISSMALIFGAFDVIDFWFQSKIKSEYSTKARAISFALVSAAKIGLIILHAPLIAFAISALMEILGGAVFLCCFYEKITGKLLLWKVNYSLCRSYLLKSWPLVIGGVFLLIQARVDQVFLGTYSTKSALGEYSAALRIVEALAFLPMIIQSSLAPEIARAKHHSEHRYQQLLARLYSLTFISFMLTAVPLMLVSKFLVAKLYGVKYDSAGVLLQLLCFRLFFTNFGIAKSIYYYNENLLSNSLINNIIGTLAMVFFNLILIPAYGAVGTCISGLISFFCSDFIFDMFRAKTRLNTALMLRSMWNWKIVFVRVS